MLQRAVDRETASEILVAVDLAKLGAGAALIGELTGFGPRWVRRVVQRNGGAIARRERDPHRWIAEEPNRSIHAAVGLCAYGLQPARATAAMKLKVSYEAYCNVMPRAHIMDVNMLAQMIELYDDGDAQMRLCTECREAHLVLAEQPMCSACRLYERTFCRACQAELPHVDGPPRAYCISCAPRPWRVPAASS